MPTAIEVKYFEGIVRQLELVEMACVFAEGNKYLALPHMAVLLSHVHSILRVTDEEARTLTGAEVNFRRHLLTELDSRVFVLLRQPSALLVAAALHPSYATDSRTIFFWMMTRPRRD